MKPHARRRKADGRVPGFVRHVLWLGAATVSTALAMGCVVRAGGSIATQGSAGMEYDMNRPGADIQNFNLASPSPELCRDACASDTSCQAYTYVKPGYQGANARCWLKGGTPAAVADSCCVSGVKGYAATALPPPAPPPPPPAPVVVAPPAPTPSAPPPPQQSGVAAPIMRGLPPSRPPESVVPPPGPPARGRDWDRHDQGRHHGEADRRDGRMEQNVDRPGSDFQNFDLPRPEPELCERACRDNGACRAFTFVQPGVQGPSARCWLKNSVPQAVQNGCCISGVR